MRREVTLAAPVWGGGLRSDVTHRRNFIHWTSQTCWMARHHQVSLHLHWTKNKTLGCQTAEGILIHLSESSLSSQFINFTDVHSVAFFPQFIVSPVGGDESFMRVIESFTTLIWHEMKAPYLFSKCYRSQFIHPFIRFICIFIYLKG